ncbi:MAG TPA: SDR family NAD(P)-dependent oxidoreductase [Myxococcota bacterium]|nr:SDR family NAD(P)-dependent oxidoreductase [Myxococcota bacterium]
MFELDGKIALVTGAGQGVGAGIARMLAARGAAVGVNDLVPERAERVAKEIGSAGGRAQALAFDVTDAGAVRAGVARLEQAHGSVDVLVNNAGVPEGMALEPFRSASPESWSRYVDLNLYGVLHCTRAVVDGMCERRDGRIITISSGAGQVGLPIGVALYGAGKGGAIAFMRHLAMEVARYGVTANSLALGLMSNATDAAGVSGIEKMIPLGRAGRPEDVGAAVVFLASREAGWITGQTIGVNGGSVTS